MRERDVIVLFLSLSCLPSHRSTSVILLIVTLGNLTCCDEARNLRPTTSMNGKTHQIGVLRQALLANGELKTSLRPTASFIDRLVLLYNYDLLTTIL